MDSLLLVIHILVAAAVIGLVLLQQGKGADAGAAFGSGASATVFGARGSANFLSRATAVLATVFFVTSLVLAYFSGQAADRESVVDRVESVAPSEAMTPADEVAPEQEAPLVPEENPVSEVPSNQ